MPLLVDMSQAAPTAASSSACAVASALPASATASVLASAAADVDVVPSDAQPPVAKQLWCRECRKDQRQLLVYQKSESEYYSEADAGRMISHQRFRCSACALVFDRYFDGIWDTDCNGEAMIRDTARYDDFYEGSSIGGKGANADSQRCDPKEDTTQKPIPHRYLIASDLRTVLERDAPKVLEMVEESEVVARIGAWHHWVAGLKLILEAVCRHFDIPEDAENYNLKLRMDALRVKVPEELKSRCNMAPLFNALHLARESGNEVAHMLQLPPRQVRMNIFTLIEHLLNALFMTRMQMEAIAARLDQASQFASSGQVTATAQAFAAAAESRGEKRKKAISEKQKKQRKVVSEKQEATGSA